MRFIIHGHVPSKKNSKRLVYAGHRPLLISSKAHEAWHTVAMYELKSQVKGMANRIASSGPHKVTIELWGENARRSDLTNKAESIMDLFVDMGIFRDDNWNEIPQVHIIYRGIDRKNPRAEITVEKVEIIHSEDHENTIATVPVSKARHGARDR